MERTVLVVDDSLTSGRYLSMIVEANKGYKIVGHARTGLEAVKMYQEHMPDVVFMDIMLPELDGIEATSRITQMDPKAKVIILSSMAKQADIADDARSKGACEILSKPVTGAAIMSVLKKVFDQES